MDSLPSELVTQVLEFLPPSSLKNARLTCRCFNSIIPSSDFTLLASFLDPAVAVSTIEAAASDLTRRPRSIWSPRCSVPDHLEIPESFLVALRIGLLGIKRTSGDEVLTLEKLGKKELSEDLVRQAMFRWVLYLSYTCETESQGAHMWVLCPKPYR